MKENKQTNKCTQYDAAFPYVILQIVMWVNFGWQSLLQFHFHFHQKYSRQLLYFTKISIRICCVIGYPVHGCNSALKILVINQFNAQILLL